MLPTPEQIRERLSRRIQAAIRTPYNLPYPVEQASQMLLEFYLTEMGKRSDAVRPDEQTLRNIASAAKWLTGNHKPGLLLYGTVGSGKTTLANAICSLIDTVHDSALESERKFVRRINAARLAEAGTKEAEFIKYKTCPMLFIDDLGIEPASVKSWGNELRPVSDVIYHRHERMLFTIMTSNLDDNGLAETYGLRIADRITEMFDRISYRQESYRK